jgi:hypothetical protein
MHATHYIPQLFWQRIWNKSGLALFAGSVVLATVTEAEESITEIRPGKVAAEEDLQARQNASLPTAQGRTLETELKNAQERVQLAEKNADVSDPNASPKAEHLASTQPSDSSVQFTETAARPWLAIYTVPAAIESQNEENKGSAVPLPTPSAAASMLPTPPAAQTNRGIPTSLEVNSLKELILEYHRLTMVSPQETSFPQMGAPDSTQTPVPAVASEINRPNASPESSVRRHVSARVVPPKIFNIRHRSFVRSRFVDVKARLIALWHQSLARSQPAHSRTVLSNSKKDANKKADAKLTID